VPNKKKAKGDYFERQIVKHWQIKGYWAQRMYASRPFDVLVMGNGLSLMIECKYWAHYPKDFESKMRKKYNWLADMAKRKGCQAWFFYKVGRGKDNYMSFRLEVIP
jgi:Holliday junction resolvase